MKIEKPACAGTLESSDVYVEVSPCATVEIEVSSVVAAQFEHLITQTANQVLEQWNVSGARLILKDRGALDCTIRARIETALRRAAKGG